MIAANIKQWDDVYSSPGHMSVAQAMHLLARIENRDANVLQGLYNNDPFMLQWYQAKPERIFGQEWGVAKENAIVNPDCILVSGTNTGVAWGPFLNAGLVPLAHSHPFHRNSLGTTRALAGGGCLWNDINGVNPNQEAGQRLKVFPSAGDVAFCAFNDLATHTVKTPYCSVFADQAHTIRWIVNHDASPNFALAPRLNFRIYDVREVGQDQYTCSLVAMEGETDFWRSHNVRAIGGGGAGLVL